MTVGGHYPIGGSEIAAPKHWRTEALHPVIGNVLVVVKIAICDLRSVRRQMICEIESLGNATRRYDIVLNARRASGGPTDRSSLHQFQRRIRIRE